MNARICIVASACGITALVAIGVIADHTTIEPAPVPAHGRFSSRLEPVLEGIGSTRDLAPVPLGGAASPVPTEPGRRADKGKHDGRASRSH